MTTAEKYALLAQIEGKIRTLKTAVLEEGDTDIMNYLANLLRSESETLDEEIENLEAE